MNRMKYLKLLFFALALAPGSSVHAQDRFSLTAGYLTGENGVSLLTIGRVVLVTYGADGISDPVQAGGVVSGDDEIVFNNLTLEDDLSEPYLLFLSDIPQQFLGRRATLRWFPELSANEEPTLGQSYGEFSYQGNGFTDSLGMAFTAWQFPALASPSGTEIYHFAIPASPSFVTDFAFESGDYVPFSGEASLLVVPEPGVSILLLSSGLFWVLFVRHRRAAAQGIAVVIFSSIVFDASADLAWESEELQWTASVGQKSHEFTFTATNNGAVPVTIQEVAAGCSCLVTEFSKTPIPPGQSAFIAVRFVFGDRSGSQSKSIAVRTDSSEKPATLRVTATIPRAVEIAPASVTWSPSEWSKGAVRTVRLTIADGADFKPLKLAGGDGVVSSEITKSETGYDVSLRPAQNAPPPTVLRLSLVGDRPLPHGSSSTLLAAVRE